MLMVRDKQLGSLDSFWKRTVKLLCIKLGHNIPPGFYIEALGTDQSLKRFFLQIRLLICRQRSSRRKQPTDRPIWIEQSLNCLRNITDGQTDRQSVLLMCCVSSLSQTWNNFFQGGFSFFSERKKAFGELKQRLINLLIPFR